MAALTKPSIANSVASKTAVPRCWAGDMRGSAPDAMGAMGAVGTMVVIGASAFALESAFFSSRGSRAFKGRPNNRCMPAQAKQQARQSKWASSRLLSGQPTVLAKLPTA